MLVEAVLNILIKLFDKIAQYLSSMGEDKYLLLLTIITIVGIIVLYKIVKLFLNKAFPLFVYLFERVTSSFFEFHDDTKETTKYEKIKLLNDLISNLNSVSNTDKDDYKLLIEETLEDLYGIHIPYHHYKIIVQSKHRHAAIKEYKLYSKYLRVKDNKFYWLSDSEIKKKISYDFLMLLSSSFILTLQYLVVFHGSDNSSFLGYLFYFTLLLPIIVIFLGVFIQYCILFILKIKFIHSYYMTWHAEYFTRHLIVLKENN